MTTTISQRTARLTIGCSKALRSTWLVRHHATAVDRTSRSSPPPPPPIKLRVPTEPSYEPAIFKIRGGPTFHGTSFGARSNISAEAVFTTSLVGYPESMTDPSYRGQILVFTQPLIGNYGVPSSSLRDEFGLLRYLESPNVQPSGIVVGDVALQYSHWTAVESLSEWCAREGVPAISGVDTREIVTFLREQGSSLGKIAVGEEHIDDQDNETYEDPAEINLVESVSTKVPFHVPPTNVTLAMGNPRIALLDCGVKENIIRSIVSRGASVTCLPYDYPIHQDAHHFDGVFISNGPGDPTRCKATSANLRQLMDTNSEIPIMGICLGHQLIAIAAGAKTIKMKYGNRAHNIPVMDVTTGKCYITSQNHGYAVDATTLPPEFKEYFTNLNDGSNEGMIHASRPLFTTQFHPEAKGGPQDTNHLFDAYLEEVESYRQRCKLSQGVLGRTREDNLHARFVDYATRSMGRAGVSRRSHRFQGSI